MDIACLLIKNATPEYSYWKTNFITGLTRLKRVCEVIFQTSRFVPAVLLLPLYKNSNDVPTARKWDLNLNPHFVNHVVCSIQLRIHDPKQLTTWKWRGNEFYFRIDNHALCIETKADFFFFLAGVVCGMKRMERLFIPANSSQLFNQHKIHICWQK